MKRITIVLTEECNAKCEYCYVFRNRGVMTEEIALKSLNYLDKKTKSGGPPMLILSGGEPLLQYDLLKRIVRKARQIFGDSLFIGMPTNGTLLDREKLDFARKNKINIAVSIDGTFEHNKFRPTCKKSNTFSLVEKKIPLLLEYNDLVRVRMSIHPTLANLFYDDFIHFYDLGFKKFSIQPVMGVYWGSEQIRSFVENFKKAIIFSKNRSLDLKSFIDREVNLLKNNCCGGVDKEIMIDTKGDIYQCCFFLFFGPNTRKKYKAGNVHEGVVADEKTTEKLKNFRICSIIGEENCARCNPSVACSKFCLAFNIKTRKEDALVGASNFLLEKKLEQITLELADKFSQEVLKTKLLNKR